MTHVAATSHREPAASSQRDAVPGLLRFITCGSVDDGKSTLIGRLLAESGNVSDDHVAALAEESRRFGTRAGAVDYALLLDGLAAEREQGITIDVAHRYFSTPRRAFIVADTPGHQQYTRNMATGASRADLAVLLVDAQQGVLEQTRRHALIVGLLGVRDVVLAINKMDLAGFSEQVFRTIDAAFRAFAEGLDGGAPRITSIPLCARDGDNVTTSSARMPWYRGPTLLDHLETVDPRPSDAAASTPLRFPVQMTLRPDDTFRGHAGTIAAGTVAVGQTVRVLPSGQTTRVARIATAGGDLARAETGQAVTLVLQDALDVARGDMLVADPAPSLSAQIEGRLLWSSERPLDPSRAYLVKLGTATVPARLDAPSRGLDVGTGLIGKVDGLAQNGIADVTVHLDRALPLDTYARSRATGSFIVIDRETNETVAMGTVRGAGPRGWRGRVPKVPAAREGGRRSLVKAVSWRITGSLDTFLLAWLLTGNAKIAVSIGGAEVFTKLGLYYLHERAWARVRFGLKD